MWSRDSERSSRMLRRGFAIASVAWAVAVPLAAAAANQPQAARAVYAFALSVYGIGALVCHQLPHRSFHLSATPWPVCARCAGIYFGAAAAALAGTIASRAPSSRLLAAPRRTSLSRLLPARDHRYLLVAVVMAGTPTAITLVYEWISGTMPSNAIRAAAGLPLGAVVAWLVVTLQ